MGITFCSFGELLTPLFTPIQAFVGWLSGAPQAVHRPAHRPDPSAHATVRIRHATAPSSRPLVAARRASPVRVAPLRVIRVVESHSAPASAGRMFMSGRMADVCAELDRLAAKEAAAR